MDRPLQPDPAVEDSIIESLVPEEWEEADWSVHEVTRLAVRARLTGDVAGEIAAHRLLADVLGATRGGHAEKRGDKPFDVAEAEEHVLAAADEIRAERKRRRKR